MNIWIRKNGIGHAFSRELGCDCRRCTTVNYNLTRPPQVPVPSGGWKKVLAPFDGWNDPPWRAHTSASVFVGAEGGDVEDHILIDCGAGVVDSLMASGLKGLENLSALLITHWHPDHILSINQLCESLRRNVPAYYSSKLPLYCTQATYDRLKDEQGLGFECSQRLDFRPITPEKIFDVPLRSTTVRFTPLPVAHGRIDNPIRGAVVFAAEIEGKSIVFGWDINVPSAQLRDDSANRTNEDIIRQHLDENHPDVLFMASNTWAATGTGHTSYELARDYYISIIKPKKVFLTHLSGHEDKVGQNGYGWTDAEWDNAAQKYGHQIAKQGMILRL